MIYFARHDITEILLKVALNTIKQPTNHSLWSSEDHARVRTCLSIQNAYDNDMYGWDLRRNYNMLLSLGGAFRNYGKLTHAVCPIKILDY